MSACKIKSHQSFHVVLANEGETEILKQCFACNATWHESIESQPLTAMEAALANIMSADSEQWLYGAIMSVLGQLPDDILIRMSEVVNDMREQEFNLMEKEKTA